MGLPSIGDSHACMPRLPSCEGTVPGTEIDPPWSYKIDSDGPWSSRASLCLKSRQAAVPGTQDVA